MRCKALTLGKDIHVLPLPLPPLEGSTDTGGITVHLRAIEVSIPVLESRENHVGAFLPVKGGAYRLDPYRSWKAVLMGQPGITNLYRIRYQGWMCRCSAESASCFWMDHKCDDCWINECIASIYLLSIWWERLRPGHSRLASRDACGALRSIVALDRYLLQLLPSTRPALLSMVAKLHTLPVWRTEHSRRATLLGDRLTYMALSSRTRSVPQIDILGLPVGLEVARWQRGPRWTPDLGVIRSLQTDRT